MAQDVLYCAQGGATIVPLIITNNGTTAAITEGSSWGTVVRNGAGDITFTLNLGSARQFVVLNATSATANLFATIGTISSTSVQILTKASTTGTATDAAALHVALMIFSHADQR